jgi:hypothetical protein
MEYRLVQRSTGRVVAQESNEEEAGKLAEILESMYGLLDVVRV